ncbi:MAG TPA: hypothetical protein VL727_21120 [Puia sp.]|jgi:hypothetical protein|nr:hypothetical protein [Puia sp.]
MNTFTLIKIGLFLHLTGITMMVGTTFAGMSANLRFRKLLFTEREKAFLMLKATDRYPVLQAAGAILILLGGVIMMIGYHGVIMQLLWFKIKLVVIALILLNQLLFGVSLTRKLRRESDSATIDATMKKLTVFNGAQIALFLLIFLLSSFRFS